MWAVRQRLPLLYIRAHRSALDHVASGRKATGWGGGPENRLADDAMRRRGLERLAARDAGRGLVSRGAGPRCYSGAAVDQAGSSQLTSTLPFLSAVLRVGTPTVPNRIEAASPTPGSPLSWTCRATWVAPSCPTTPVLISAMTLAVWSSTRWMVTTFHQMRAAAGQLLSDSSDSMVTSPVPACGAVWRSRRTRHDRSASKTTSATRSDASSAAALVRASSS